MALKNKIVSVDEAIAIIRDGDTLCVSGFVGIGTPDELILALERRFLQDRHPSGLTLMFAAAPGDGKERGPACSRQARALRGSLRERFRVTEQMYSFQSAGAV